MRYSSIIDNYSYRNHETLIIPAAAGAGRHLAGMARRVVGAGTPGAGAAGQTDGRQTGGGEGGTLGDR